ncbi:flagellar biosynthesis repressor FlbT [Oricola cellulosilytica]|uniref:Probable flagellum biosynthesis repressor protein FlbT n=1 Tax=Oricola cellulosilytica TaxID=1429082 RepID=A0A4R0PL33_9HYPH|nr:flagellar biosynthesis repressor FlbT [Oricola cellulosilytica]TCD16219.1 flagellar biosynthesis repressor FlbT [Oricola cellulosilytica]
MKSSFKIFLKANERIFINGAVLRVDRKVSLELLNDVQFLLENHVLQAEDASTPLRQLYFIVQVMVMSPSDKETALPLFRESLPALINTFSDQTILSDLKHVDRLVREERYYEALKTIRGLYDIEAEILGNNPPSAGLMDNEPRLKAVGG